MSAKLIICLLFVSSVSSSSYHVQVDTIKECDCYCPELFSDGWSVCKKFSRFEKELFTVKNEIERRTKHVKELEDLKERMELQEIFIERLLQQMEDLKKSNEEFQSLPTPQALVMNPEDNMLGDSNRETRVTDNGDLAKNMSNLLAKVEVVENLTSKVQEELKSERRVRRHLEEDLNDTRSSVQMLDDKLKNVTFPTDSRNALVEEVMLITLESLNKTLFEDYLQQLNYRVDGVVYKNETKKLDERLDKVEIELLDVNSVTTTTKFMEEFKTLSDVLSNLNETVREKLTLTDTRLDDLETKTNELEYLKDLDEQLTLLQNASELIHGGISDIWKDIQDVRNYTVFLEIEMHEQTIQRDNVTDSIKLDIFKKLENITSELSILKSEVSEGREPISALQEELEVLAADLAITENRIGDLGIATEKRLKDFDFRIKNFTTLWDASLVTVEDQTPAGSGKPRMEKLVGTTTKKPVETIFPTVYEWNDISAEDHDVSRGLSCTPPKLTHAHLLMTLKNDSFGRQKLEFGCRPIGRYALNGSTTITCLNGMWQGRMPTCQKLLGEHEGETGEVRDLIPSILIDPDNVDKPYGMMGTGTIGELIVYPGTSFTLVCLIPDRWPTDYIWKKEDISLGYMVSGWVPKNHERVLHSTQVGMNRLATSVTMASSQDSGIYVCQTPSGKKNSVKVIVDAVHCPPIPLNKEGPHNAYYRPHPDGQYRILSTLVQFQCAGGSSIKAMCQADGTWSRTAPTSEECPSKDSTFWGCSPIDTTGHPNLILERDDTYFTITFRCAGRMRLDGIAFTRCSEGSWTYDALPTCIPRTGFY